ncbi:conserved hypothetical protein [Theileria orientalis strain Shintoku]|uniref:Surface protein D n=1 Tax=Theileria orientalis strain Shintoku TaxID=869250 RepID=J7M831_THEOR|nr:conserved hypothetical protein [Theileria orientalis strain Shintoku]PVC50323.1 hypothetical protein MACL_00002343 [Theileria orientalis]BAM38583.1 conserved hypothetical protein [Theileria orientalis strain Shintoku]|eukprot:XP_009688884.1 conserved hypothetical protein [Theileria orientalis strain Shintoku]
MKITAQIIFFLFTIFAGLSPVSASGSCSEDYLYALGMKFESEEVTKAKSFRTSSLFTQVATELVFKMGATPENYRESLIRKLVDAGLYNGEQDCVECFSNSIRCVIKSCKAMCFPDPCKKACLKCVDKNCKSDLLECVGQSDVVNPCVWAKEFEKYKSSSKGNLGGASGSH